MRAVRWLFNAIPRDVDVSSGRGMTHVLEHLNAELAKHDPERCARAIEFVGQHVALSHIQAEANAYLATKVWEEKAPGL